MEIVELMKLFGTQEQCIKHIELVKWNDNPICPYCKSERSHKRKNDILRYKCLNCNVSYTVLVGTMMEATKLPLPKWFAAIFLILNAKKGISSLQLSRDLGVNKNTGWYLQKRIRESMNEDDTILQGIIEADETYVGGSLVHKHLAEKNIKQYDKCGMNHKVPVLGMLQRKGKIVVKVLDKAWGKEIKPLVKKVIDKNSDLVTDGFGGYKDLGGHFNNHIVLNHSKNIRRIGEYHTSSIEGFWTILKRAIMGQYHKITKEHLQSYLDEIAFKYNYRHNDNVFDILLKKLLKTSNASI